MNPLKDVKATILISTTLLIDIEVEVFLPIYIYMLTTLRKDVLNTIWRASRLEMRISKLVD